MKNSTRTAAVTTALGVFLVTGAPAALAQSVVDPYSQTEVLPIVLTKPAPAGKAPGAAVAPAARPAAPAAPAAVRGGSRAVTPSSLPFTGGEVVTAALAGVALTAAGAVLVAAGRRRQLA